jgi:hypothetical protein
MGLIKSLRVNPAGRKAARDPKRQVYVYIEQSVIDRMGGIETARELLTEYALKFGVKKL